MSGYPLARRTINGVEWIGLSCGCVTGGIETFTLVWVGCPGMTHRSGTGRAYWTAYTHPERSVDDALKIINQSFRLLQGLGRLPKITGCSALITPRR